jgi:two-component system, NarL family, nitrate/nitrite response regulator NarL
MSSTQRSMDGAITVFVGDDHPLYREALEETIGADPGLALAGAANDGRAAFDAIARLRPDVAVLDVHLPIWQGPEVARRIARDELPTRVLFLSEDHAGGVVYGALAAGGEGYLTKRASRDEIRAAIHRVAAGEPVLSSEAGGGIIAQIHRRASDAGPPLGRRESEVLQLMAEGCSSRQIAEQLHLATATIKTHTQTLYRKLGVANRGAAVAEGMRRGLLD